MKALLIWCVVFILVGCEPRSEDVARKFVLPDELRDCSVTYLVNTDGVSMNVFRCPGSTVTTHTGGKHPKNVVVIDGVEYESK